jgi:hypothetical protein
MKRAFAALLLALLAGACALPSLPEPAPLPGEVSVKKVDRVYFQEAPRPNLYRIDFDAERSKAIRARFATESPWDKSDPYHALVQYLELVAERELKSRSLCNGIARLMTAVDGLEGTGPMSAIFGCIPPVF